MPAVIYTLKITAPACFLFSLSFPFFLFFSVCAFIRKLLVDGSLKLLALLYVIRFFYPLECNLYHLGKKKKQNLPQNISKCQLKFFAIVNAIYHDRATSHQFLHGHAVCHD